MIAPRAALHYHGGIPKLRAEPPQANALALWRFDVGWVGDTRRKAQQISLFGGPAK
jgi:hypothetical protein